MTTINTALPVGRESLQALSDMRREPAWLAEFRQQALELAGTLELPHVEKTRIDRWNIDRYGEYKEVTKVDSLDHLPEEIGALVSQDAVPSGLLIQRNSGVIYSTLSEELKQKGVILTDLETAAREHEHLVRTHLMQAVKADEHRLAALHAALWSGGLFLYVPKNVVIEEPIQALFLSDDADALFAPHVLIIADENSSVTYVDNYLSGSGTPAVVHNGVAEVFVKNGASVRFASIHNLNLESTDITYRRAVLEQDARIEWTVGELHMGDAVSDTHSLLKGNGSGSDAKVICVGTNKQRLSITTRATHIGKSSESDMITRAVMRDEATAIINGITKIEHGATHANGEQTERVLMLSPKARGDANPMLLIDEDEVKAGHAASVGQVNKEQVFYLMSRGLTKEQAEKLIIYGFLAPVVNIIPIKKVEEQLKLLVERKLGQ